jgi:hypothetical protein
LTVSVSWLLVFGLDLGLVFPLFIGVLSGLFGALLYGGEAYLRHYCLRFLL